MAITLDGTNGVTTPNLTVDTTKSTVQNGGSVSAPAYGVITGALGVNGTYVPAANTLGFVAGGAERGRFTANGLTFNGDTAAANALDDYEEGDFTPTLTPGGGSYNGLTLTGKYTKVGRLVSVQMNLTITASGNASGGATVANLPFTSVGSWNRMPNKWRENAATGACGQFTINHGQTSGFMQNDDGTNIAHTTGRVYLINAIYYSA